MVWLAVGRVLEVDGEGGDIESCRDCLLRGGGVGKRAVCCRRGGDVFTFLSCEFEFCEGLVVWRVIGVDFVDFWGLCGDQSVWHATVAVRFPDSVWTAAA